MARINIVHQPSPNIRNLGDTQFSNRTQPSRASSDVLRHQAHLLTINSLNTPHPDHLHFTPQPPTMSAIQIDPSLFSASAIPPETTTFNQRLIEIMRGAPKWYEVGAAKYREMRARGETPLPPAKFLDSATQSSLPSRDAGRDIPIRILKPQNSQPTGIYLHIHGGGWVLQTEKSQDVVLQDLANTNNLMLVSIGYRLAPEDP